LLKHEKVTIMANKPDRYDLSGGSIHAYSTTSLQGQPQLSHHDALEFLRRPNQDLADAYRDAGYRRASPDDRLRIDDVQPSAPAR
jgi:hypothetical protein